MKKVCCSTAVFGFCLLLLFDVAGCNIHIGSISQAKFQRTVDKQSMLGSGSTLVVSTSSGSITITGADVSQCSVLAEITARAPTEEEAQNIAEQVFIMLEKSGPTLTVKADKPDVKNNRSISISYDITVPRQTIVKCKSSYGSLKLSNIDGDVSGKTSSGAIEAQTIAGSVDLDTSYGSVTCLNATGGDIKIKTSSGKIELSSASFGNCDLYTSYGSVTTEQLDGDSIKLHSSSGSINVTQTSVPVMDIYTSYGKITCREITAAEIIAKTSSGGIDIVCSNSSPSEMTANVVTSYGSIDFTAPADFAGQVELGTNYGSVRTDLPVTIIGQVNKKKISGTVGQGTGKLYLKTSSGSVRLKK
jgi:DUF4097 and DUF4098 domain-containing protein YvlB